MYRYTSEIRRSVFLSVRVVDIGIYLCIVEVSIATSDFERFAFVEFGPLCNDECLNLIYSSFCELYPVLLGTFGRCIRPLLGI